MTGNETVLRHLNRHLTTELTGRHQYTNHSRLLKNWGVSRLAQRQADYAEEERQHADVLADRILFLGGAPDYQNLRPLSIGKDVRGILQCDLGLVNSAIEHLRTATADCEREGDYVSYNLMMHMLQDEEEHYDWLAIQLRLVDRIGIENYITLNSR
ncbi:MAG TPA: bacterioferritin [Hyphomicrobium sp.]|nr:bacterioferritin [Hyphomicrobium sp.]